MPFANPVIGTAIGSAFAASERRFQRAQLRRANEAALAQIGELREIVEFATEADERLAEQQEKLNEGLNQAIDLFTEEVDDAQALIDSHKRLIDGQRDELKNINTEFVRLRQIVGEAVKRFDRLEQALAPMFAAQVGSAGGPLQYMTQQQRLGITLPTGSVLLVWDGQELPPGEWLFCDGSEYARADYPLLSAMIGTPGGTASSTSHFRVPDLDGTVTTGLNAYIRT